ncbi:MAG: DUF1566 domain-containing protein, partial [Alphaproteobacteria bacterium]
MKSFKHLWSSFCRQTHGVGMIEAAITLPLFLVITFGIMEFGNMYLQRYQVGDVSSAVKDYLQANPAATLTTPDGGLTTFVSALGIGLKNTGSGTGEASENRIITKIRIASSRTMFTAAEFDDLCGSGGQSWANPWESDSDAANDNNPYYIHVCYPYTYRTITPLSGLTAGAIPNTKTMYGKALAYIGNPSGTGSGGTTIADISCPSGQMVSGFSGGQPVCAAIPSGGGGCSRVPGTVLSDGTVVADACSTLVTTPADGPNRLNWSEAKNYCENLTAHGHSDWFLPTLDELQAISQNKDAIGGFVFPGWSIAYISGHGGPNTPGYWTSSFAWTDGAMLVYFDNKRASGNGYDYQYFKYRARCIR